MAHSWRNNFGLYGFGEVEDEMFANRSQLDQLMGGLGKRELNVIFMYNIASCIVVWRIKSAALFSHNLLHRYCFWTVPTHASFCAPGVLLQL